jgi:predicted dehydrogenase
MKRIGMGLVGPGFVAAHHIDAVRRLGFVDVVALASSSIDSARKKAAEYAIPKAYGSYQDLAADPDIHVVHNTTPNHVHAEVIRATLAQGKHIVSDKPLAMTATEAGQLLQAARDASVVHAVTFNYRGNPMVQQARELVARGEIGGVHFVHGAYLQDWLLEPGDYSWRLDPKLGGSSSALGDIGSHWCDTVQHVTGLRIEAVLADLTTVIKKRRKPTRSPEAFATTRTDQTEEVEITSEDLASVLLRFENGAKASFSVGQVLAGHKNGFWLEVNGSLASLRWHQERQNELWIGRRHLPEALLPKDPPMLDSAARSYTHLPGGHQEGWSDAFFNVIRDIYAVIARGQGMKNIPPAMATFEDGYRANCMIEAMLDSHAAGNVWKKVAY